MLAGVDGVIVGAGNPDGLPAVCSRLVQHAAVTHELSVMYRESGENFHLTFDPRQVAEGRLTKIRCNGRLSWRLFRWKTWSRRWRTVKRNRRMGSSSSTIPPAAITPVPQGPLKKDEKGQPIYGPEDEPDLQAIRQVGLPFWLAGGYGSREELARALAAGATGVQVGSVFALAEESGMKSSYRSAILNELKKETDDSKLVLTTLFSPTGFPFKVVQLEDTLADQAVYADRMRVCDIGLVAAARSQQTGRRRYRAGFSSAARPPRWMISSASAACRSTPPTGAACVTAFWPRGPGPDWPAKWGTDGRTGHCHPGQPPGRHPAALAQRPDPLLGP